MAAANAYIPGESAPPTPVGDRNFTTVWILSLILGSLGVDRFYLGKVGTGILKLLTLGGAGIWYLIDLILILTGGTRDKKGMALANEPSSKKTQWIISGAVIAFLLILTAINNANSGSDNTATVKEPAAKVIEAAPEKSSATAKPAPAETVAPAPAPAAPTETMSQKNAKATAQDYLAFSSFSRSGLIGQLEFEGFSTDDATYAVDATSPNWDEQAAQTAADYLEYSSFSRQGLLDQLLFEGFSQSEAEYGVTAVGY